MPTPLALGLVLSPKGTVCLRRLTADPTRPPVVQPSPGREVLLGEMEQTPRQEAIDHAVKGPTRATVVPAWPAPEERVDVQRLVPAFIEEKPAAEQIGHAAEAPEGTPEHTRQLEPP